MIQVLVSMTSAFMTVSFQNVVHVLLLLLLNNITHVLLLRTHICFRTCINWVRWAQNFLSSVCLRFMQFWPLLSFAPASITVQWQSDKHPSQEKHSQPYASYGWFFLWKVCTSEKDEEPMCSCWPGMDTGRWQGMSVMCSAPWHKATRLARKSLPSRVAL